MKIACVGVLSIIELKNAQWNIQISHSLVGLFTVFRVFKRGLSYITVLLLTFSMAQNPSWEANSSSASQEISRILWNSKAHYRVHKSPPFGPKLSHINAVLNLPSSFFTIPYNIAHSSMPISTRCPSTFPIKPFILFSMHAIRPTNLILLDFNACNVW